MKRVLLILLLFALLIVPAFSRGSLQGAKPVRLGVIVDGPWERNEELWGLLQKGIQDVLGNNTQVIFPGKAFSSATGLSLASMRSAIGCWTTRISM